MRGESIMLKLFTSYWLFAWVVLFIVRIIADKTMLNKEQKEIKDSVSNINSFEIIILYITLNSLRYFKHIYNQNLAVSLTVVVLLFISGYSLKIFLNELKGYDRKIFPTAYIQLRQISSVFMSLLFLSSTPIFLNHLLAKGYVPLAKIDFTTLIIMALMLFVVWRFRKSDSKDDNETIKYKPIFKREESL